MASEIEQLPDLSGFLKIASTPYWQSVRIELPPNFKEHAMQGVHFTPGTLDPENVRRHGTVAHMPLASGNGEFEVSCLYLAPGGSIAVEPKRHPQLLLVVNGKAKTLFSSPRC